MPNWRCPHCGTPQSESARCWVCRRSSTSCLTCRNFRASIAPKVGYCGLDRGRALLGGGEIRPCWETRDGLLASTLPVQTIERTFPIEERADAPTRLWVDREG